MASALSASLAIGHIAGVKKILETSEGSLPSDAAFSVQAQALVEALDLDGLEALVSEARK